MEHGPHANRRVSTSPHSGGFAAASPRRAARRRRATAPAPLQAEYHVAAPVDRGALPRSRSTCTSRSTEAEPGTRPGAGRRRQGDPRDPGAQPARHAVGRRPLIDDHAADRKAHDMPHRVHLARPALQHRRPRLRARHEHDHRPADVDRAPAAGRGAPAAARSRRRASRRCADINTRLVEPADGDRRPARRRRRGATSSRSTRATRRNVARVAHRRRGRRAATRCR